VEEAGRILDLQVRVFNATTAAEIDTAFAEMGHERVDALLIGGDPFLYSRGPQIITLAARDRLPVCIGGREQVEIGALMSYGTINTDTWRQVGIYTGSILKGVKPADLPVMQSTKFESAGQRFEPLYIHQKYQNIMRN
jgi:ABC-type uncharacterized transport system substrate-binding protein